MSVLPGAQVDCRTDQGIAATSERSPPFPLADAKKTRQYVAPAADGRARRLNAGFQKRLRVTQAEMEAEIANLRAQLSRVDHEQKARTEHWLRLEKVSRFMAVAFALTAIVLY
jgi:hypothetical protein